MVERKVGPVLAEMLEEIEGIQSHTTGKTLADFEQACRQPCAKNRLRSITARNGVEKSQMSVGRLVLRRVASEERLQPEWSQSGGPEVVQVSTPRQT